MTKDDARPTVGDLHLANAMLGSLRRDLAKAPAQVRDSVDAAIADVHARLRAAIGA